MFSQKLGSSELGTWRKAGSMTLSLALHVVIAGFLLISAVLVTHNLMDDDRPFTMVASLNYTEWPGDPGQLEPQPNTLHIPQPEVVHVDIKGSSIIHVEELKPAERMNLLVLGPPAPIAKIAFGHGGSCGCIPGPRPRSEPLAPVKPVQMEQHSRMHEAVLLKRVDPVYPSFAKRAGIQGAIVMHATIDREGRIIGLSVVSGPQQLRDAAADAVRQWEYRPYVLNGLAVEIETTITVNFVMPDAADRNPSRIL